MICATVVGFLALVLNLHNKTAHDSRQVGCVMADPADSITDPGHHIADARQTARAVYCDTHWSARSATGC